MQTPLISIIVPVYNERTNITELIGALDKFLPPKYHYEYLFIDDGSTDDSLQLLLSAQKQNSKVKIFSFTRNFGHQAAIYAGLAKAMGDAVITMDGDFQDPPKILPRFIEAWEKGNFVVYGRRKSRNDDKAFKKYTAKIYYKLLTWSSKVKLPEDVGDFRLLDRKVVIELMGMPTKVRYLRGIIAWLGFEHTFIDYKRPERHSGKTKYSFKKMLALALDGFFSFSMVPLKLGLFLGILSIATSILFLAYIAYDTIVNNEIYPLYKWLVVVLLMLMGLLFILIWILAEYIDRIYDQSQNKPLFVIKEEHVPRPE